jgi:hypothetical protein
MVVVGAATYKGIPKWEAAMASCKVPILLAVSPLAAMRSAPTMTADIFYKTQDFRSLLVNLHPHHAKVIF